MSVDPASGVNAVVSAIAGAIRQAAQATSTSFGYLLATAKVESNFDPQAKASNSSASGLFQFIEQTWLSVMKEAGPGLGYGQYADAIGKAPSGRLEVADPAMRAKILNLRHDPSANAVMAGAFTEKNASLLTGRLGRPPSEGELYIAHFLGASGAAKLITSVGKSQTSAADLFPNAASANRSIFYDKQGRARSAGEVYATLTNRYDVARAGAGGPPGLAVAAVRNASAPQRVAARIPDTAGIAQAFAASNPVPQRGADAEPIFRALFHTGERRDAVAPRVNQLWSAAAAVTRTAALPVDAAAPASRGNLLDLFQDRPRDRRGLFGGKS
jgi:hypothetical protein